MPLRISLFGAAGSGKSTLAADIYAKLKAKGHNIELVREGKVKDKAYKKEKLIGWDGYHIFSEHLEREEFFLRNNCNIITDCPLFLNYCYTKYHDAIFADEMLHLCKKFDKEFLSLNMFVERDDKHYKEHGRYENLKEAKEKDLFIKKILKQNRMMFVPVSVYGVDEIIDDLDWCIKENDGWETKS